RDSDDAVEALSGRSGVHLHVARRVLEPDGGNRRHPHRRLLGTAAPRAVAERPVQTGGPLLVHEGLQSPGACRTRVGGRAGHSRFSARRRDTRWPGPGSEYSGLAVHIRMVRDVWPQLCPLPCGPRTSAALATISPIAASRAVGRGYFETIDTRLSLSLLQPPQFSRYMVRMTACRARRRPVMRASTRIIGSQSVLSLASSDTW